MVADPLKPPFKRKFLRGFLIVQRFSVRPESDGLVSGLYGVAQLVAIFDVTARTDSNRSHMGRIFVDEIKH